MWIKSHAKVLYDPHRPGLKKDRPGTLVVANVDPNIAEYYRFWVKNRFGLILQNTAWYPHITIINGKAPDTELNKKFWRHHQGKMVEFEYSVNIEQHWKFWVLPCRGEALERIRKELGLSPTYHFHITIGRME